jgi:competence protein ComEC
LFANDAVQINVIAPLTATGSSDNSDSVVLRVDAFGRTLILPGDLEGAGMELLLSLPPIDCDIAMAPHHGSENSEPAKFFSWCAPEWVVISGARKRVDQTLVKRISGLGEVLQTGLEGAIRFEIDADGVTAFEWRRDHWQTHR